MKFYKKHFKVIDCLITSIMSWLIFYAFYINYPQRLKIGFLAIFTQILIIIFYFYYDKIKEIIKKIIKFRYLVAIIVFVLCVLFKVHGSSIDCYNFYFSGDLNKYETVEFGKARSIRSDEYMVHTPYYFSQYYNNYKKNSKQMSLSGQDMIIGYNAPVKDITLLVKPLTWGYILLGNDYGLSWYWMGKIILLILVSFELCMLITKGNEKISLIGSLLIAYSPPFQWFFIPHAVDVFLWGMWLCVLAYYFFTVKDSWKKNLIAILGSIVLSIFVLALYPACQVPVGLLALTLFIVLLVRDREKISFEKMDILRIFCMIIFVGGILGYTLYTSKDAIRLLNNTVYPGATFNLGGNHTIESILTNLTTIFLPFKDSNVMNNCEVSTFIHLTFPFLIVFPELIKGLKKKKESNAIVGICLVIVLIIELVFMLVGFPRILARITLFSYINRIQLIYGFTGVLFTIWTMCMIWKYPNILSKKIKIISITSFIALLLCVISKENLDYMPLWVYILEIVFFGILVFLTYTKRDKLTIILLFLTLLVSSFTINPISRGTESLTGRELSKEINKLAKGEDKYFMTVDSLTMQNFLLANGAKVINAVNFYPDFKKWHLVDKEKKSEFYYNRYLHTAISLVDGKTKYKINTHYYITVNLSIKDLRKLPVKYILSTKDLSDLFDKNGVKYKFKNIENYFLYELKY